MELLITDIAVSLDDMLETHARAFERCVAHSIGVKPARLGSVALVKKSVDARNKNNVHFKVSVRVCVDGLDDAQSIKKLRPARGVKVKIWEGETLPDIPVCEAPNDDERPLVVGFGPAGMFCALTLARAGLRPIVVERGRDVDARTNDVDTFNKTGVLNENSNIQFGEGGAGTFSDGKLNTGTKSPYSRQILRDFVDAGAPADILVDAHPHIGTDYLPKVVKNIRKLIVSLGGEIHFETQFVGVDSRESQFGLNTASLLNIKDDKTYELACGQVVLACGHSARDTYQMISDKNIAMERKPFAVGVRIEHLQEVIDKSQYGKYAGHPSLGAAEYKLAVHNKDGRGVYTFCMCPGGSVVAASSEVAGVCTNGMSRHARDSKVANSALLVEVKPDDLAGNDVLEGVRFQRDVEHRAYNIAVEAGGVPYSAPMQCVGDFVHAHESAKALNADKKHTSQNTNSSGKKQNVSPTYPRGTVKCDIHQLFPSFITNAIYEALPKLNNKLHGFASDDALLTAPEARSSSPVRIIRDKQTCESASFSGLYPAGEGAGYAGGIMSAANDGIKVALAIIKKRNTDLHDSALKDSLLAGNLTEVKSQALATIDNLDNAADILKLGSPLIFETDTVCGLGVSPTHAPSPDILYELKNRSDSKPVAWLVSSIDDLPVYGKSVPDYAWALAREFWPGGLSIIVSASERVPKAYVSASRTIGLRMPADAAILQLIAHLGSPIATTSANVSGQAAVKFVQDVDLTLLSKVAVYLPQKSLDKSALASNKNGEGEVVVARGDLHEACASSVVDCTGASPKILREGSISAREIERVVKELL